MGEETLANLSTQDANDLLNLARERFKTAEEAESDWRRLAEEDIRFRAGDQWDPDIRALRDGRGNQPARPCLTINRLQGNIRQITNGQRLNKIGIKVIPSDDDADVDTADVIQGLIRHIESASFATSAYETAFTSAVERGKGYFRIVTEFNPASEDSFEQDIRIKRIRNPMAVYFDPTTECPVFSDANWAFIITRMSHRAFATQYPDADAESLSIWATRGTHWVNRDEVLVAEYFYIERDATRLVLLEDGRVIPKDKMGRGDKSVAERTSMKPTVFHVQTNGFEILDQTQIPGAYIPIVPILGDEIDLNGRVDYAGVVRYAKDPQRAYNYWVSAGAEMIAMVPKTPVVGVAGQFTNFEKTWNTVNTVPYGYLEYNAVDVEGRPAPPPQRLESLSPVHMQAITLERQQATDDLKAATGIFDASLGARSNETSGIAITRRQQQGDVSTLHFTDSKTMAIWQAGRILIGMIPHVYDTPRTVRILGEDESEEVIRINEEFDQNGKSVLYDMTVGKYDVQATVGTSFGTKRQEALELTTGLVDKYPPLFPVIGDQILKNIDGPGAEEMANRFRKTIDPRLLEASDEANPEERLQVQVMQLTQQLQQMQQAGQQLMQQTQQQATENEQMKLRLANKEKELELKERELALEIRLKEQELQLKREIEERKLDLQEDELAAETIQKDKELALDAMRGG